MMIRLDKYLADMGAGTRSEIKKSIRAGRAAVNGAVTKRPETRIDTEKDTVELDGRNVSYEAYDLFPVGRLDKDTEGLLLITNDGALAHRLLAPAKHVDKIYFARVRGAVTAEDTERFARGLDIGDEKPTLPADLTICSSGEISEITLTIREGRFHQVKRMFQAVGKEVVYLKRLGMGPLMLDERLKPGEYRRLTEKEVEELCSLERKQ